MAAYAPVVACRKEPKLVIEDMSQALKAPSQIPKLLEIALRNVDSIRAAINLVALHSENAPFRSTIGMAVRSWGASWRLQVLYSLLSEVVYADRFPILDIPPRYSQLESYFQPQLRRYSTFLDFVFQQNLQDAYLVKPVMDGNAIKELFGVKQSGSFLATAINDLIAWQFDNKGSGLDDAKKWLYRQRERLGVR
jgi:tRNA nucleotidyltransferase (CCA-adding enzyme)